MTNGQKIWKAIHVALSSYNKVVVVKLKKGQYVSLPAIPNVRFRPATPQTNVYAATTGTYVVKVAATANITTDGKVVKTYTRLDSATYEQLNELFVELRELGIISLTTKENELVRGTVRRSSPKLANKYLEV